MRLLSPDIRCAFQCESQLNMATDAGATAAAMLRRKTGELVAARVLREVFTIPLADLGLQDLQVSVVMYMEEKSEATSPLHRLDGLDGPDDSPPVPELTLLERMRASWQHPRAQEPSTKRLCRSQVLPRVPDGVRPDNARNILCLRIGTGLGPFAPFVGKLANSLLRVETQCERAGTKGEFKRKITGPCRTR
ncbi:Setd6 [Symbiodinium necroappetens]|uniref:Setd6 protein n=1 Tax=Symbiodinium necroappetens TaxID=1628268 RepID=A0A812JEN4_9DINO|nr:Setd6 [Symbiodinium necroappetens]